MRRLLDCDFFLGDEGPADPGARGAGLPHLRAFPGPHGIVIADARVWLAQGERVRHGEAFSTRSGVELVYYLEHDEDAAVPGREVAMRFVVRGARYDPGARYSLRPEPAVNGIES